MTDGLDVGEDKGVIKGSLARDGVDCMTPGLNGADGGKDTGTNSEELGRFWREESGRDIRGIGRISKPGNGAEILGAITLGRPEATPVVSSDTTELEISDLLDM